MNPNNREVSHQPFILEGVVVKPATNELIVNEASTVIEDKVMKVPVYLVDHRSKIVTREELFTNLWPEVYVSQDSLNRCISIIRKFWSKNVTKTQVILTIRNRGYRIIGEIKPTTVLASRAERASYPVLQKAKYVASGVAFTLGMIFLLIAYSCLL